MSILKNHFMEFLGSFSLFRSLVFGIFNAIFAKPLFSGENFFFVFRKLKVLFPYLLEKGYGIINIKKNQKKNMIFISK